jgi:DNA helicase II / ATP-dependent DNA helicase PcrA
VDAERLLDGLNDEQRRAVTSTGRPLCILAGAGSGKTRVLTRRIAYRVATGETEARHVLALTFTRKAAGELNHRLRSLGLRDSVAAGTFHAVAYAQLRARWADRNIRPPTLLDRKLGLVARLLPSSAARKGIPAIDVVNEIEWAKARTITPGEYPQAAAQAGRRPALEPNTVAEVFDRYEREKRTRRLVDFDDLLRLCTRDLTDDREFAGSQRWRFRHLFVDEFQDVNPLQARLLDAWLGDRLDLCVVGDPAQAIYGWNGADAGFLHDLAGRHPSTEMVRLTTNYRSSPQILAVANTVLADAIRTGDAPAGALRPSRPSGPEPRVSRHDDDREEARAVARAARDLHRPGGRWSDQAVLVRTHAQTALIEEALHAAQVPFRVRGRSGLLDQAEVRATLKQIERATDFSAALADIEVGADEAPDAERAANLAALVRLAHDYAGIDGQPTVVGFLAWLTTTISEQPDREGDAVEIATFHSAKGLEWNVVHLAGLEQGLVPIGHARTRGALAEERRLFYVAVTRASHELRIYHAQHRTFGTKTVRREPSPYLEAVELAVGRGRSERRPGGRRRSSERRRPPSPPGGLQPSDDVLSALRTWRSRQARAADVPAYVIFHDRTLEALATTRPRTRDELLALPGLGPVKVSRYGDELLGLVAEAG